MTQEEKELLIKDLSARIPYKVKAFYYGTDEEMNCTDIVEGIIIDNNDVKIIIGQYGLSVEKVKPYLFPLSSMTEKQYDELMEVTTDDYLENIKITKNLQDNLSFVNNFPLYSPRIIDWLNKNQFDYHGLIPMGLALDATGLNIY